MTDADPLPDAGPVPRPTEGEWELQPDSTVPYYKCVPDVVEQTLVTDLIASIVLLLTVACWPMASGNLLSIVASIAPPPFAAISGS